MTQYIKGAGDPSIKPDKGSGKWCSSVQESEFLIYKRGIESALALKFGNLAAGEDATKHLEHYFNNTGNELHINLKKMIDSLPSLKLLYEEELAEAKQFAASLPAGSHWITSSKVRSGYARKKENSNWFYAVGGYAYWGKAKVTVIPTGNQRTVKLEFNFKLYDRYNWDKGKKVTIGSYKITDDFMQKFHRQCYAREFNVKGSFKKTINFKAPSTQIKP